MGARAVRPTRFQRTQHLFVAVVPALIVVLSITGFVWAQKTVTLVVNGHQRAFVTQSTTVAGLLRDAGVQVGARDVVMPSLECQLRDGDRVVVRRAVPVTLEVANERIELEVLGDSVADALVAAGMDPSETPGVEPAVDTPLRPGVVICAPMTVVRVMEESVALPFATLEHGDSSLAKGKREVVTAGTKGRATRVYRTLVTEGFEGERVLVSERIVSEPVDRVVAVGTAPSRRALARAGAGRPAGAAKRGRRLTVTATAYAPGSDGVDWRTATGAKAGLGVIAVDPRVIPLGTRVYVPGYGYGTAADTGGAIKGARIDLCYESRAPAMLWGRRTVTIVVLD